MPADRTRGIKRTVSEGAQPLTWATPVEATKAAQSIAFAPNLTPVTFNDPPPTVDASGEPSLFPTQSSTESSTGRRPGHGKKKPEDHIPRPPNAFILFRSSFIKSQHVSTEVETNHSTLSKIIGLTWQNMPHDERQVWHAKAKKAQEDHRRKFPQYAFRPTHAKNKGGTAEKRKVREVEPKDLKRCAKIAELLVEGKKGKELDEAILEFDKHHIREVVTRFEAPITARAYRRSSSAPVDDAQSKLPFLSSAPSHHRKRSSSTQPQLLQQLSPVPSSLPEHPVPVPSPASLDFYGESPSPSASSHSEYSMSMHSHQHDLDPYMFSMPFEHAVSPAPSDYQNIHYPQHQQNDARVCTPSLSVDTSFCSAGAGDWTRSSSPYSSLPATPQAYSAPANFAHGHHEDPFGFNSFSLDAYSHQAQESQTTYGSHCGGAYAASMHGYADSSVGPLDPSLFAQGNQGQQEFDFDPARAGLAPTDEDLSAFMVSLGRSF
ncbi:hypothetical protein CONPUDRAFT_107865 [Coniophora puteana RWD-64-598 SS2]|uniref:HMG box domain-containing protein n=1 Tax=Coniophora puteana (strain RWD-64-598) TaxID=741705 RepID=A0A5M3MGL8_CONPW|nr:uncharacterized protein CONPUDRAFT_107865 [Coniophora puteana RWD-64-598 SS2]EIW78136.1 hypothetical protein CONPUDRAFT_107865 [Coniophora puteana RWD-64-598 SS2]